MLSYCLFQPGFQHVYDVTVPHRCFDLHTEMLILNVQVIIQLRKFAQAAKRIKAAVGTEASAPQLAKAVTKGDIKAGDLSDIIGTEIRDGMDTSAFGELELLANQFCS